MSDGAMPSSASCVGFGSPASGTLLHLEHCLHAWQPDGEMGGEGTHADATKGSQAVKPAKTLVGKAAALVPVSGEIPVMMPEKLPLTKVRRQL